MDQIPKNKITDTIFECKAATRHFLRLSKYAAEQLGEITALKSAAQRLGKNTVLPRAAEQAWKKCGSAVAKG